MAELISWMEWMNAVCAGIVFHQVGQQFQMSPPLTGWHLASREVSLNHVIHTTKVHHISIKASTKLVQGMEAVPGNRSQ